MPKPLIERYNDRLSLLEETKDKLQNEVNTALNGIPHIDRVYFRVKNPREFVKKANDKELTLPYKNPLVEIEDQVGGRVIVFFLQDIETVKQKIIKTFNPIESEYRKPKKDEEFSYESHHLILLIPPHLTASGWKNRTDVPNTFELQIRTIFMHAYAEPQHDFGYKKESELSPEHRKMLAWIASSSWGADQFYQRLFRELTGINNQNLS